MTTSTSSSSSSSERADLGSTGTLIVILLCLLLATQGLASVLHGVVTLAFLGFALVMVGVGVTMFLGVLQPLAAAWHRMETRFPRATRATTGIVLTVIAVMIVVGIGQSMMWAWRQNEAKMAWAQECYQTVLSTAQKKYGPAIARVGILDLKKDDDEAACYAVAELDDGTQVAGYSVLQNPGEKAPDVEPASF